MVYMCACKKFKYLINFYNECETKSDSASKKYDGYALLTMVYDYISPISRIIVCMTRKAQRLTNIHRLYGSCWTSLGVMISTPSRRSLKQYNGDKK